MPHRPVLLGIVGDSAAGKTTITSGIAELLGPERVTTVCVDDYHRYNRADRKRLGITALHPDCNYIDIMEQHVRALADRQPILKPNYNHTTGDFDAPTYIQPKSFVIIEGLLGFHTQALRDAFHVKVYLDPPEPLRRAWKIKRDCTKRGYQPSEVLAELDKRESDSAQFIRPQKQYADLVVRFFAPGDPSDVEHLNVQLTLRPSLPHPDLTSIVAASGALTSQIERENGRLIEHVTIDGPRADASQATIIEDAIWGSQPEVAAMLGRPAGAFLDGDDERLSTPLAVAQHLIGYHVLRGKFAKDQLQRELEKSRAT
jgi:phosphoribulokinase